MRWMEGLMCWFKPSHWRDHHSLKAEERPNPVEEADGYSDPQDGVRVESYDRVDLERDVRKP